MIVARQKKKDNIIEYVLYMWQIEDLIRANHLDMGQIDKNIISSYRQNEDTLLEIRDWWANLVEMMRLENKAKAGHLQVNINTVNDIHQLHLRLMSAPNEVSYHHIYNNVAPVITEFENKTGSTLSNPIETGLTAIYSTFLMKLKHQSVNPQTELAIKQISQFMAALARKYNEDQKGKLDV